MTSLGFPFSCQVCKMRFRKNETSVHVDAHFEEFHTMKNPKRRKTDSTVRKIIMLDEMTMKDGYLDSEFDGTNCIIDLSRLADSRFKNVDFVICMNPRLSNKQKFNIEQADVKYTLKGKLCCQ